ncbi:MAG TPA: Coq4 family protein [Rhizomicrobium sp.]
MAEALDWNDTRKDWRGAFIAIRKLLADPADTVQVFRVMQGLNRGTAARNYQRLLKTQSGGQIAYTRVELVSRLTDRAWLSQFASGTVGAAYRAFLDRTGFSADGLADISKQVSRIRDEEHPFAWFGRRERDIHDVSHVLTGYRADDPLGELCLVAYTYAQNTGLGWGFIALMGTLKSLTQPHGRVVRRAVWEGYRHGKQAAWLHGEDIEALFAEPLEAARARMNIARPIAYERAQESVSTGASSWLAAAS